MARAQSGQKWRGVGGVCKYYYVCTSMENGNIEGVDATDGRVHKCVGLAADVSRSGENKRHKRQRSENRSTRLTREALEWAGE